MRLALAERDRESEFSDDREPSFHQSDKGEAARLRAVQGIFREDKSSDKFGDGSHINRLEGFREQIHHVYRHAYVLPHQKMDDQRSKALPGLSGATSHTLFRANTNVVIRRSGGNTAGKPNTA